MKPSLARLVRLHALRSSIADAASLQTRQVDAELTSAGAWMRSLQDAGSLRASCEAGADVKLRWSESLACTEVAVRMQLVTADRIAELSAQQEAAREAQRAAVTAREQVARLLERCRREVKQQADRHEQMRLDEAHASSLVRKGMPTRF